MSCNLKCNLGSLSITVKSTCRHIFCYGQSLNLVNLSPPFIDHQPLNPSHSPARSFVVFTASFLSVRYPLHFEHIHVVGSELEYDDPLDLHGSGQTMLTCLDSVDHVWITNIWLLPNFKEKLHFTNFLISFCKQYFKDCI